MTENNKIKNKSLIVAVSIILPIAVAALFKVHIKGIDLSFLPPIYATINGLTSLILIMALMAIRKGNVKLHERLIKICLFLSIMFLLMYVAYHTTSETTKYGGEGFLKYAYYFILISHIILSIVVIPFVLFTYAFGKQQLFVRHKKLAKITFPLWWYVAFSGVLVYSLISQYY